MAQFLYDVLNRCNRCIDCCSVVLQQFQQLVTAVVVVIHSQPDHTRAEQKPLNDVVKPHRSLSVTRNQVDIQKIMSNDSPQLVDLLPKHRDEL